jgi:NitT/TauT family transport system permease protein
MKNSIFRNQKYIRWLVLVIWLVIWYVAAHLVGSGLILPGPHATLMALLKLVKTKTFYFNVLWTLLRTVIGIAVSFVLGAAFAVLADRSMPVREFLRLPVNFFKSIPVMAIIIYVILIVRSDWVAVVVCFLMCFPIAYTNILNGLEAIDVKYRELGAVLGLGSGQMTRFVIRPSLEPQIKAALSLITAMSWKVVVASEVLAIPKFSIGYQMLNSKYYLETADLFAYIIVLIVLSFALEKLVASLTVLDHSGLSRAIVKEAQAADKDGTVYEPASIRFNGVSKSFESEDGGVTKALDDFSCEFGPGVTGILAPSGAGKTTMARLITGLEVPDSGELDIAGDIRTAYLFQEDRLLPWLNVRGNMLLSVIAKNPTGKDPLEAVEEIAEKLEISDTLGMMPQELSGGMAHRAALGRTLLFGGNVLILDEPFRGLDEELKERIIRDIASEIRPEDSPKTVILITHDEELAERLADKVIRI